MEVSVYTVSRNLAYTNLQKDDQQVIIVYQCAVIAWHARQTKAIADLSRTD